MSIVVPNYNHAPFLLERLQSIRDQSFKDYEVIFLDDASTDESLEIAKNFALSFPMRFVENKVNSGSPFAQWNKGIASASGEFIWIAESDDVAEPDFLERMVEALKDHPDAGLAYCSSRRIDIDGIFGILAEDNLKGLDADRWQSDFVANGLEECRWYLSRANTIANASAVLIRKIAFEVVGGANASFQIAGDWDLWMRILSCSDLVYVAEVLNRHRNHSGSVRSRTSLARALLETVTVLGSTHRRCNIPTNVLRESMQTLVTKCHAHVRSGHLHRRDALRIYAVMMRIDCAFWARWGMKKLMVYFSASP